MLNALSVVLTPSLALPVKEIVVSAETVGAVPVIAPLDEFKVKEFEDKFPVVSEYVIAVPSGSEAEIDKFTLAPSVTFPREPLAVL
jgi:hypothetical protein